MDTLSVLREFTRAGRLGEVSLSSAGRVRFGADFDFDAAAPTGYVRGSGGGASAASDRYTAGALAFFAAISGFASAGAGAYMRAAREAGVPTVAVLDIKPLTAYLKGEVESTSGVVPLPVGDLPALAGSKREGEEGGDAGAAGVAKRARLAEEGTAPAAAADSAAVAATRALEAPWSVRDRNAPLMAAAKDFSFAIARADTATHAARADAARAGGGGGGAPRAAAAAVPPPPPPATTATRAPMPALPSRRYERTDGPGADAAALDDMGLGGGRDGDGDGGDVAAYGEVLGGTAAAAAGPPMVDDPDPEGTAAAAKEAAAASVARARARAAAASAAARCPAQPPRPAAASKARPRMSTVPIIIVPSAATARINLLNAGAFLEEGRFVPAEEVRAGGAKKPADGKVGITRTIGRGGGRPAVPYEITDRAPPAGSPDWGRVVAVFVGGAAWQFKGWPFTGAEAGDTVRLFSHAAGFHISLADEDTPAAVKEWNVTRLALHRTERHRDRSTVERVWRAIDDFLGPKGSKLAY